jgi:radical SAM protein with 4Fe4S-binding SPASM domain
MPHLQNLARSYLDYRLEREPSSPPIRLWVEPTSRCNLECPYCPNKDLPKAELGLMPLDLYRKIVADAAAFGVHDLNLFHRGESLIHRGIYEMIATAREHGLSTRLHTNATFLSREKAAKLLDAGLDFVSFSVDGYTKEVYERNRVGGEFEETLANIRGFLELKRERGATKPFSVLQVMEIGIDGGEAVRQRRAFLESFRGLPLDRFYVRTPHNWAGSVDTVTPQALEEAGYTHICCTFPWYSMTILYDGRVSACPQDFMAEIILGDVSRQTLAEVWNGAPMKRLREAHRTRSLGGYPACMKCDRVWRKTVLGVPTDYLKDFVSDQMHTLGFKMKRAS